MRTLFFYVCLLFYYFHPAEHLEESTPEFIHNIRLIVTEFPPQQTGVCRKHKSQSLPALAASLTHSYSCWLNTNVWHLWDTFKYDLKGFENFNSIDDWFAIVLRKLMTCKWEEQKRIWFWKKNCIHENVRGINNMNKRLASEKNIPIINYIYYI